MWQPEPGWQRLPGGGPSSAGVWVSTSGGTEVIVKRLACPDLIESPSLGDPHDVNYWRREADVALSGVVANTPGLRQARVLGVQEDSEGVTLFHERIEVFTTSGLWLADCLGRFAGADLGTHPWLSRRQLRSRLALVARRGGWRSLARTPMADIAAHLWERRTLWLERSEALTQVAQHGDPCAANIPGRFDGGAKAIDWGHLGLGPIGSDLGYLSLATKEELEPLVEAYLMALPPGLGNRADVLTGARVTAVYMALTRLDWALARVSDGEGALTGKFKHPSVAPYIFAMQRQAPQIEALLG